MAVHAILFMAVHAILFFGLILRSSLSLYNSWHTFLPSGCQFKEREKQSSKLGSKIYITWTAVHHKNVYFKYLFWIKFTRTFKVEIKKVNSQSRLSKPNLISQKFAKSMQIFVYKSYFAKFSRSRLCKPPVDV